MGSPRKALGGHPGFGGAVGGAPRDRPLSAGSVNRKIGAPGPADTREVDEVERAAVLLDHRATQAQAQAHALALRGEEGREQACRHVVVMPGPRSITLKLTQRGCVCWALSVSTRWAGSVSPPSPGCRCASGSAAPARPWCGRTPRAAAGRAARARCACAHCAPAAAPAASPRRTARRRARARLFAAAHEVVHALMTRPARSACSAMRCAAWRNIGIVSASAGAPVRAGSASRPRSWRSRPAAGSARGSAARPSRPPWPGARWPAAVLLLARESRRGAARSGRARCSSSRRAGPGRRPAAPRRSAPGSSPLRRMKMVSKPERASCTLRPGTVGAPPSPRSGGARTRRPARAANKAAWPAPSVRRR